MKAYDSYVATLEELARQEARNPRNSERVNAALDGEASSELRRLVPIDRLRRHGAFFTGERLRTFAVAPLARSISSRSRVYDPACGAGDLLLACAKSLPTGRSLAETLHLWSRLLSGTDIHPAFVRAARMRLQLAALRTHGFKGHVRTTTRENWFHGLFTASALTSLAGFEKATHVVLNPPFNTLKADSRCSWTSGAVNAAAIFLERTLAATRIGTRIVAILPEVLRCGARYAAFRSQVESQARLKRLKPFGLFDNDADVDVFVLDVVKTKPQLVKSVCRWGWARPASVNSTIEDDFRIAVGAVVDFRDPTDRGSWQRYLRVEDAPAWARISDVARRRRFTGTTIRAPFVAIRRTSRPGDTYRAVGTVVTGREKFAVDNHLIICRPRDRTVAACDALLRRLHTSATTEWLDHRMCCRHLTISSVRDLPWWDQ